MLNKYMTKLYNCCNIEDEKEEKIMNYPIEKEIKEIIQFIEKNKKLFSCYEKCAIYIYCFVIMELFDPYLSSEYLEKALKYSENRNYEYEKFSLKLSIQTAKFMRSDIRYDINIKKLKEFYQTYFPNQKKLVDILMEKYKA